MKQKQISEKFREQRNKKTNTENESLREQSVDDLTPQPKKSFVENLRDLMKEYTVE